MPSAVEPGSPEWLAERAGKWTGSKAKALMTNATGKDEPGATAKSYAFQVAAARLAGRPVDKAVSSREMERGQLLEPQAINAYVVETMRSVSPAEWLTHPEFPTVGATNDGGMVDDDGLLEVKCPDVPEKHLAQLLMRQTGEEDHRAAAVEYRMQNQWELWVSGRAWCDVASYHPDFPAEHAIAIVRVFPDLEMHKRFAARVKWGEREIVRILREICGAPE